MLIYLSGQESYYIGYVVFWGHRGKQGFTDGIWALCQWSNFKMSTDINLLSFEMLSAFRWELCRGNGENGQSSGQVCWYKHCISI